MESDGANGGAVTAEPLPNRYLAGCKFDEDRRRRYLYLVRTFGPLASKNARAVGVHRNTVGRHLDADTEFRTAYDEALRDYLDELEQQIHRRGSLGWDEPVFYRGRQVGTVRKFDSGLLMSAAKRHMPEYRDKLTVDANVRAGVLVVGAQVSDVDEWVRKFGAPPADAAAPSNGKGDGHDEGGPAFKVGRG